MRADADSEALKDDSATTFFAATVVPPGGRVTADLRNISTFGPPSGPQTVTQRWLSMGADGRFALSGSTLGTGIGSIFGSVSPDERGRYAFLPGGELRLSYEDGHVTTTNALVLGGTAAAAAKDGLFLGGSLFFRGTG